MENRRTTASSKSYRLEIMVVEDNMVSAVTEEETQSMDKLLLHMEGSIPMEKALHTLI